MTRFLAWSVASAEWLDQLAVRDFDGDEETRALILADVERADYERREATAAHRIASGVEFDRVLGEARSAVRRGVTAGDFVTVGPPAWWSSL